MILPALQGLLRSLGSETDRLLRRPVRRRSHDRVLLERHILPFYGLRLDVRCVLFVGCARYTQHYETYFARAEYWTLDARHRNARWGARRHIWDRLERVDRHVGSEALDLVVCNGVLGWGLDRHDDAEAAFAACYRALRPGGELVLGWNDVPPRNRVRPESISALRRYQRSRVEGLRGHVVRVDGPHRHVFEFYRKPLRSGQGASVVGASEAGAHAARGLHEPSTHRS